MVTSRFFWPGVKSYVYRGAALFDRLSSSVFPSPPPPSSTTSVCLASSHARHCRRARGGSGGRARAIKAAGQPARRSVSLGGLDPQREGSECVSTWECGYGGRGMENNPHAVQRSNYSVSSHMQKAGSSAYSRLIPWGFCLLKLLRLSRNVAEPAAK